MKTFNTIQMIVLLMAAPTVLQFLHQATFSGALPLFWIGLVGTFVLSVFVGCLAREGLK